METGDGIKLEILPSFFAVCVDRVNRRCLKLRIVSKFEINTIDAKFSPVFSGMGFRRVAGRSPGPGGQRISPAS